MKNTPCRLLARRLAAAPTRLPCWTNRGHGSPFALQAAVDAIVQRGIAAAKKTRGIFAFR